ncbi:TonB-dependent receptor [Stenotrophobium rhamnosiphilum]|uniref:TonB-dependent receptor n=1 Tax=Stenotrophobium rhamnosiphilum TaxID=2029166 RepID=UPI0019D2EB4A|nr:TonB-dependent receptor [Stenotrophobium rhamnosiphilum]
MEQLLESPALSSDAQPGSPRPDESSPAPSPSAAQASVADPKATNPASTEQNAVAAPKAELDLEKVDKPYPPKRKASQLEEIVVTAQRREENLQAVPISITVLSQAQLSNANITNSADLARYVPSLSTNNRFGPENASFTIRGFTQDFHTSASVGVYFADMIAPRGQSTQTSGDGAGPGSLWDLQNVQVLKGPQGTLFGRNTTGGAILIVPKKPTDEFEGYVDVTGGNFNTNHIQAVVNFPVNEDLRMRVGVDRNQRDGNLTNITRIGADKFGDVNYTAGRLSAVWDITDKIENYSILSFVNSDTAGYTQQLYACNNPITRLTQAGIDASAILPGLQNILTSGRINLTDPIPGVPIGSPFALLTFQSCEQQLADQKAAGQGGFYDVVSAIKTPITVIKERRFINSTTWKISDNVTFKNNFSYAHLFTKNGSNIFGTRFPDHTDLTGQREFPLGASLVGPDVPVTNQKTVVEEIQLLGDYFDQRLIWQAGLYYEHSTPDGLSGNNSASFINCDLRTIEGQPSQYNCFDPIQGILGGVLSYKVTMDYLNLAAYGQGSFNFTDQFSMTFGMRYTKDKTEGYGVKNLYKYNLFIQQAPTVTVQRPKTESQAPTGMIEFNYHPNDGLMTYAKYTRGYRQGNVNIIADPGLDIHEPEYIKTYEVGLKSSFEFLIPGRINVAAFKNELTDMQLQGGYISTTSGPTTAIFNAGKGESQGFEIESTFQPLESLTASLSYSYLKTKLVKSADFCGRVAAVGLLEGISCTPIADVGDELPFAPKSSYVINLNWAMPVPEEFGQVSFGSTYAYTGKQRAAATSSTPFAILEDFGILNLNLNWNDIYNKSFDFSIVGTNVLDKNYVTFTSGTYKPLGVESRSVGLPRMISARLKYSF